MHKSVQKFANAITFVTDYVFKIPVDGCTQDSSPDDVGVFRLLVPVRVGEPDGHGRI